MRHSFLKLARQLFLKNKKYDHGQCKFTVQAWQPTKIIDLERVTMYKSC